MSMPLRVLIVEDSENDTLLVVSQLELAGYETTYKRVETAPGMTEALDNHEWDVIISDHQMPHFSSTAALRLVKDRGIDIPFIIVSGAIGEEVAVEAMRAGAMDYLMKDNLARLVPAIQRELRELQVRKARKLAERELRLSQERFRNVFEQGPLGIALVGLDYRTIAVNAKLCEIVGYTKDELSRLTFVDVTHPDDIQKDLSNARRLAREEIASYKLEKRLISKRGEVIWIDLTVSLIRDDEGKPDYFFSMIEDISARKKAEDELRESEERFAKVFRYAPALITLSDVDTGIYFEVNDQFCRVSGFSRGETIGRTSLELGWITSEDRRRLIKQVKQRGHVRGMDLTLTAKDGRPVHCIYNGELVQFDDRQHLLSIAQDISERRYGEEALRKSEALFRSVFESTTDCILVWDKDYNYLYANQAAIDHVGNTRDNVIGKNIRDGLGHVPEFMRLWMSRVDEVFATGKPMRVQDSIAVGEKTVFSESVLSPIATTDGSVFAVGVVYRDVTERRKAEEVQRRLATAIEQAAEAIIITDANGTIQYVNPATEIITGFGRSEIIGQNPRVFKSGEHDKAFYDDLWKTITSGEVWSGRFVNRKKDGTLYSEDATISPVRDASGKTANFVAVKRDVTEHLQLTKQLSQAQKMEAIGTLAGGIAHDFNNLLTVIMGYSELLLAEKEEQDTSHADLRKINHAAHRGADLVQRLLAFSRKSDIKPRPLDLNHQIEQLKKMLTRTIPKMIEINLVLADNLSRVNADPTQVDQALMNLIVNAKDAMPDGGTLTIQTSNAILDEEYARAHLGAKTGAYVLLSVSDTGHGMDKETLAHIFEPFYTTKDTGKGTGLGLAMVYGIVKQHDGYITCYSELGQGTTFTIYLPALAAETDQSEMALRDVIPQGGAETILLVDDEEFVRDLGTRILRQSGYTVLTAVNGKEALHLYKMEKERISLVILDLIMPEMGGKQCLEELLKMNPHVKVLIASGFVANGHTKEAVETGARGFVSKPYRVKQMLQAVRKGLDSE